MSNKTKASLLIISCILVGLILGVILDRVILLKLYSPKKGGIQSYRKELINRLKLNQAQQVRLDSILSWSQREFKSLSKKIHPKFDSLKNALRDSIRSILTPEQLSEFEKMLREKNG